MAEGFGVASAIPNQAPRTRIAATLNGPVLSFGQYRRRMAREDNLNSYNFT